MFIGVNFTILGGVVGRRLLITRTSRAVNICTANSGANLSKFKLGSCISNLHQIPFWKTLNFHREICVFRTVFSSDAYTDKITLRHDPDTFGNESDETDVHDKGDIEEENYVTYPIPAKQQLRIKQYADMIKSHFKNKDVQAAVDILENRMIKEDRVKPDSYIYSLVISGCGRFGHAKKALQLFRKMRDRGLKVPGAVYTALFNACANHPQPEVGLQLAKNLQNKLLEKQVVLNETHYHAMMKAFGRCGDLARAFQVADLMMDKKIQISEESFNFLLHACISDTQAGFRHALLVWNKMLKRNIKPTIYSFNLMLRIVRDCNMGQSEEIERTLQQMSCERGTLPLIEVNRTSPTEDSFELTSESSSSSISVISSVWNRPDLLSPIPVLNYSISELDLSKPHERLLLLGGSRGFLQHMAKYEVTPTIKTYTLLLDCLPPTIAAEKNLIKKIKKDGIPIDIEFCNMLIKKRSFRFDYNGAQDVLKLIQEEKLFPDIITFGVLALACTNEEEARRLIRNMRQAGYRINVEILGAMLKQGCIQHNFKYVMKVLNIAKEEEIRPSPVFKDVVNRLIASSRDILRKLREGDDVPPSLERRPFRKEFTTFMYKYEAWLKEMEEKEKQHFDESRYAEKNLQK